MMQCNGIEEVTEAVISSQVGTAMDSSNGTIHMESDDKELCKTVQEMSIAETKNDKSDQVMTTSQLLKLNRTSYKRDIEPFQIQSSNTGFQDIEVNYFGKDFLKNIQYIDELNKKGLVSDKLVGSFSPSQESDKAFLKKKMKPLEEAQIKALQNIKIDYFSKKFLNNIECQSGEINTEEKGSEKSVAQKTPQNNKIKLFSEEFMKSIQCHTNKIHKDWTERKPEVFETPQNVETELFSEAFLKKMQRQPYQIDNDLCLRESDKLVAAPSPSEETSSALFKNFDLSTVMDTGTQCKNEFGECEEASGVGVLAEKSPDIKIRDEN
ncbi:uncharacterized protein LOC119690160 [Teleopsis dalmanni]|uniref:uncharacterized protein LOC119690160 n=1 Tax=Teleopsis dalmanni TaxID=139649 RepID=UPI0018CE699A|nr:uncharacterized protein LOC119690160 [Teleopsis dalmanni]